MLRKMCWLILLSLIMFVSACTGGNESKTVKIVAGLPTSTWAQPLANAMQLAIDEAGGMAGDVPVELIIYDTIDPETGDENDAYERVIAQKAIDDPDVVAYFGSTGSDRSKAIMPMLNEANLLQISPSASWPGLTKPGYGAGEPGIYYPAGTRHFFRMGASDDAQGVAAARWAHNLDYKTAYIIDEGSLYATGLSGIFEVTANDLGIQIVGRDSYAPDEFTDELAAHFASRAADLKPDVVYLAISSDTGIPLVGAIRTLDPTLPLMTGDGMGPRLGEELPVELVADIRKTDITVAPEDLEETAAAEFVRNYQAAYGEIEDSNAGTAYEFTKMILHVIENTPNPTRENILAGVTNLGDYTGIFGTWHFDQNGDIVPGPISGWVMLKDQWVFTQILR